MLTLPVTDGLLKFSFQLQIKELQTQTCAKKDLAIFSKIASLEFWRYLWWFCFFLESKSQMVALGELVQSHGL